MIDAFIIFNVRLYLEVGQVRFGPAPKSGQRSLLAIRSTSVLQTCRLAVVVDVVVDNCHRQKVWLNALSCTVTKSNTRRENNGTEADADNNRRLRRNNSNSNINNNIHDPGRENIRGRCGRCMRHERSVTTIDDARGSGTFGMLARREEQPPPSKTRKTIGRRSVRVRIKACGSVRVYRIRECYTECASD